MSIDRLLAGAREGLVRLKPHDAAEAVRAGAVVVERNQLEWRLDPSSSSRVPEAEHDRIQWIVICDEGYSSYDLR